MYAYVGTRKAQVFGGLDLCHGLGIGRLTRARISLTTWGNHQQDENAQANAGPVRDVAGASGVEEGEDGEEGDEEEDGSDDDGGGRERREGGGRDVSAELEAMGL